VDVKVHSKQDQRPEPDRKDGRHRGLERLDVRKVVVRLCDDQPDHEVGECYEPLPRPPQLQQLQQQKPSLFALLPSAITGAESE
jgi:hypothetical protein